MGGWRVVAGAVSRIHIQWLTVKRERIRPSVWIVACNFFPWFLLFRLHHTVAVVQFTVHGIRVPTHIYTKPAPKSEGDGMLLRGGEGGEEGGILL